MQLSTIASASTLKIPSTGNHGTPLCGCMKLQDALGQHPKMERGCLSGRGIENGRICREKCAACLLKNSCITSIKCSTSMKRRLQKRELSTLTELSLEILNNNWTIYKVRNLVCRDCSKGINTCTHTCTCRCTHTHMHITHTYTHTHTHTGTCTHKHTDHTKLNSDTT